MCVCLSFNTVGGAATGNNNNSNMISWLEDCLLILVIIKQIEAIN